MKTSRYSLRQNDALPKFSPKNGETAMRKSPLYALSAQYKELANFSLLFLGRKAMAIFMLTEIFKSVLLMSVVGGALSVVLLCLKPLTRKLFSPKWQYYIWLMVLIVMLLPVRFSLPQGTPDIAPTVQTQNITTNTETVPTVPQTNTAVPQTLPEVSQIPQITLPQNIMWYFSVIWCFGVIAVLLTKSAKYLIFLRAIHKNSYADHTALNIPKRLQVRRTDMLDAPLIIGLIKPVLYLPDMELSEGDLNYILMHELTHYKQHDILYKWFAMIVLSIHWFNPLIYIVSKQIDSDCEVSCDAAVTNKLSAQEQDNYMNMILDMLLHSRSNLRPLTTQMASNKKMLKRRFEMIRNKKKTNKFVSALSAVIAAVMLGTTVFASGVLSNLATDEYMVEISNNGEKIELANKPFIENGEVYVPLRETFEKAGFNQSNSHIVWDNGKIYISIAQNGNAGLYGIEIGNTDMKLKHIQPSEIYDAFDTQQIKMSIGMKNVPILKGSSTYITIKDINYMLYSFFDVRDENNHLHELAYTMYDKNGNIIYANTEMNFQLKIPKSWVNKYQVLQYDNFVSFVQSATYNKYGEGIGTLCRIERLNPQDAEEVLAMIGGKLLYTDEEYAYIFEIPTDVQYPIWIDRDEEDVAIAAEYEDMFGAIDLIKNSFEMISTRGNNFKVGTIMIDENNEVVFKSEDLKNPENTVNGFFEAFADSNFVLMKNHCTEKCKSTFFGDGYCFGMTKAELTDVQIDFRERVKSSNDFNVFVTVNMTPHENSVFDKSQTSTSFYVILQRQPDGRYLIDEFATGL